MKRLIFNRTLPVLAIMLSVTMIVGCDKETDDAAVVTDIDGNSYSTVKIGNQVWMAENLKVTHFRNGDAITEVDGSGAWSGLTSAAYCMFGDNDSNVEVYGLLYNWYAAADSRGLAPEGWHVATIADWRELFDYVGTSFDAGGKLKEKGTSHWAAPNEGAEDSFGFRALPGGGRTTDSFYGLTNTGLWWSSSEDGADVGNSVFMKYDVIYISDVVNYKYHGFSVRCVKDSE